MRSDRFGQMAGPGWPSRTGRAQRPARKVRVEAAVRGGRDAVADGRPAPAFYQDMIDAMKRGRSSGADEPAIQRVIAGQFDGPRRDHYTQLADHWLAMRELRLPLVACGSATWRTPSLSVTIKPELAVRDADNNVLVVKL